MRTQLAGLALKHVPEQHIVVHCNCSKPIAETQFFQPTIGVHFNMEPKLKIISPFIFNVTLNRHFFIQTSVVSKMSTANNICSGMLYLIFNNAYNESSENIEISEEPIIIHLVF